MSEWWAAFWFFLPAGIANMSPVLAARIPVINKWRTPMDLGRTYKKKRIFGDNKSWRGICFATFTAMFVGMVQYRVITYSVEPLGFILLVTGAMGFGALLGDAVESFFKRQAGIEPGKSWFPFDQIDYIIGGLLLVTLFVDISLVEGLRIIILFFGLHLIFSYIGYLLGVKKEPI